VQKAGMPYWALTVKAIDWYYGLGEYNYTITNNRISHAAKIVSAGMNEYSDKFGNRILMVSGELFYHTKGCGSFFQKITLNSS
jgi:hypothetical protein